ncbi:hypothetical protein PoMZ_03314 [Pyricularia oryzae]|uniref:Uncharacterized protein n=2 Tax=Pyricularia oryzae TaxID=318829 RepID=A0A4P7N9G5_PYROR|nr:hypothetical protein PoMZ_03314 [Pyricularia oryzae]
MMSTCMRHDSECNESKNVAQILSNVEESALCRLPAVIKR